LVPNQRCSLEAPQLRARESAGQLSACHLEGDELPSSP